MSMSNFGSPYPPPSPLTLEQIEGSSEIELRTQVNRWFHFSWQCPTDQRAGAISQAEFYMRELERRENARIAERDLKMAQEDRATNKETADRDQRMANRSHKMEVAVIVLIGLEIIIAVVGLWYGIHEGNKQQTVLNAMNTSTGATAAAMESAKNSLKTLSDDQETANGNVQSTLDQTKTMATALKQQLNILKQEQDARLAQLSQEAEIGVICRRRVGEIRRCCYPGERGDRYFVVLQLAYRK